VGGVLSGDRNGLSELKDYILIAGASVNKLSGLIKKDFRV